jgi:hypothetical protein
MSSIIRATTTSGLQIAPDNSGSLQLQTNGTTTAVTIDTSQNVGIGTSSPSYNLDVVGNVNGSVTSAVQNSNSGTSGFARFLAIANGGNAQFGMTSTGYTAITNAQDAMLFNANGASGGIVFAQDGVAQAKFDSSGNVLVNTTTARAQISNDFNGSTISQANLLSATDVTSRYKLFNGQKDSYYDHASIQIIPGKTIPSGPLVVMFNHFVSDNLL